MVENEFYNAGLIIGSFRDQLNEEQEVELNAWLESSVANQVFFDQLKDEYVLNSKFQKFDSLHRNTEARTATWNKTLAKIESIERKNGLRIKVGFQKPWTWIAIAASIVLLLSVSLYVYNQRHNSFPATAMTAEIQPGKNGAILTLANGKRINLSNAINGKLASEAGVKITKIADGQVMYEVVNSGEVASYNTLSTTNGQQYQIILPDGSKVWLNAASSLRYPSSFVNLKERKVVLEGEGYFQVTHNAKQPFRVQTATQLVEDIGTAFNINSYRDEPATQTTLEEGVIRVSQSTQQDALKTVQNDKEGIILKPGEQAVNSGIHIRVTQVDTETAVGWKDGDFIFKGTNFKSAMRGIARWYNIEIVYDPSVSLDIELGGWISRKNNLSAVLKWIESTNNVHFKIEGRRVFVTK